MYLLYKKLNKRIYMINTIDRASTTLTGTFNTNGMHGHTQITLDPKGNGFVTIMTVPSRVKAFAEKLITLIAPFRGSKNPEKELSYNGVLFTGTATVVGRDGREETF